MSTIISTTVDLMRHGEPVGGRRYRGQIDDPLSDRGWAQMRDAVADHCPWSAVISSPLLRCAEFGRELAARHDLPLTLDARLMELGFGEWEGRTAEELMRDDPERLARFWRDPITHRPPGGESLAAFRERVVGAWEQLLAERAGKPLLVVCHAGVIRMIVRHVLDMPLDRLFRIQVPSAGLTRIRVDGSGADALPKLVFHAGHL